jgi:hypothetical protein
VDAYNLQAGSFQWGAHLPVHGVGYTILELHRGDIELQDFLKQSLAVVE